MTEQTKYRIVGHRTEDKFVGAMREDIQAVIARAEFHGFVAVDVRVITDAFKHVYGAGILYMMLRFMQATGQVEMIWCDDDVTGRRYVLVASPETFGNNIAGASISSDVVLHS